MSYIIQIDLLASKDSITTKQHSQPTQLTIRQQMFDTKDKFYSKKNYNVNLMCISFSVKHIQTQSKSNSTFQTFC